jgi:hypothetical protein
LYTVPKDDALKIKANDYERITWHLGAVFGVHEDMKSHKGATMTLGDGVIQAISVKQKVNS